MEPRSDEQLVAPLKRPLLLFAILTLLGVGGNFFSYEIFFNLQFIFGSILALLVLQFLGLRWGVAAGFLISLVTYHLWNHPYAIVIMTGEVLAVGLLRRHRGVSLVLADALYWLCLGIPLVILFYWGVMRLPFYNAELTMMKQAVNGVANALAARLLFLGLTSRRGRPGVSLRELIFSLLLLFILVPSFLLLALESRADLKRTDSAVHEALKFDVARTVPLVEDWLQAQLNSVAFLAGMADRQPLPMSQLALEQMRRVKPDFLRLGLLDQDSTTIAFSPLLDERGRSNLGVNFADRPYIPEMKRTLEPMLSEVVMGRIGPPRPIVIALAPVSKEGGYGGYVSGILDLARVRQMIELNIQSASLPGVRFVLLDRNGKVIVSSYPGLKTQEPYQRLGGERIDCGDGICQWLPANTRNISVSDRWEKALYLTESRIGGKAEWRLILEQPMAPFQKELFARYALQLSLIFAVLLTGLALAELASRLFVRTLHQAGAISSDIPARIAAGTEIVWPDSAILETQALLGNFQEMARVLADQYRTIQALNAELEGRVAERTRELQESEERYRNLFENNHTVMVVVDPDNGDVVDANPAAAAFYGWSREELKRKKVSDINIASREELFSAFNRAKKQHVEHLSFTHRLADGTLRDVEVFSGPMQSRGKTLLISIIHDVTERRQAEQRIRDAMSYIESLMRTSPVGITTYKATGETVSANEACARIAGTSVENMLRQNFRDLASWRQFGLFGMAERALASGAEVRGDVSMVTTFGKRVDLDCHFVPFRFGGEPHLMLLGQDITARRQAEKAVQASELKYRQLVEAANSVILRWDMDGKIEFINEFGARLFGFPAEELVGRNVLGTIVPEVESSGRDLARMIREIGMNPERYRTNENENITRDGRRVWVRWENRAITDAAGEVIGNLSIGYDVTARRKADQALLESEERFRTLFENAAMAVFIHDENGMLLEANRKALADNGLTSLEELRSRDFWLPPPYSREDAMRWLHRAAAEGPQHFEWQDCDRQGRVYWRDMTLRKTILNDHPRIIAIAVDINERKRAEAELRGKTSQLEALTKTLEDRVNEEVAMRLKNEQLLVQQAKLAAMGEMLGAVAHQWRQPLNTLGLCVQNINDAYTHGDLDGEYLDRTVRKSMEQIHHMSKTIDDFRDFFQPDRERAEFDTMVAVGEVLSLFSAQLTANAIVFRLTCHTHARSFEVTGDIVVCPEKIIDGYRNEFEHVVLNLISNAKDAILARREQARGQATTPGVISFDFFNRERRVIIEVGDNGGGIPEAVLPRIFEPYFTTKEQSKGTGIGLYMSRIIIEDHLHGTLTAANRGEGAVFRITLPQTAEQEAS